MNLLIATKNAHKAGEIREILGSAWTVSDLNAYPEIVSPEETGVTFMANAEIKALAAAERFAGLVLADDSGLEVDALGGAPGVWSARYAGEGATDADNRAKLLSEFARISGVRTARFRCAMALAENGKIVGRFDGTVEGHLLDAERGEGGFGYDPLFVPAGERLTFAELPAETKNRLSHRGRALAQAVAFLQARPKNGADH